MSLLIRAKHLLRDGRFESGWLLIQDGKIKQLGSPEEKAPKSKSALDLGERWVIPGLIDLHIHGFAGIDCSEAGVQSLKTLSRKLALQGTTSFLATLYPASLETLSQQLSAIRQAKILGAHIEGPFVNPLRAGALPRTALLKPDPVWLKKLLRHSGGVLKRMTLAPELAGSIKLIHALRDAGAIASMGHSDSRFEEARKGARAGARSVTHLFNAMRPFHHREPGLAGFALQEPEITAELIADFHHVSDETLEIVFGRESSICLISDCLKGGGTNKKSFRAGGALHEIRNGASYLAGSDKLSGSCSSLLGIVRGLVQGKILSLEQAIYHASTLPATQAGVAGQKGQIRQGFDADLLALGKSLQLEAVFLGGARIK